MVAARAHGHGQHRQVGVWAARHVGVVGEVLWWYVEQQERGCFGGDLFAPTLCDVSSPCRDGVAGVVFGGDVSEAQWSSRGRIVAHGHIGARPLYRVGDVLDLIGEDARRRAG